MALRSIFVVVTMNRAMYLLLAAVALASSHSAAEEIEVSSVLIKLIEQVEVPAREAGVLAAVAAREGQMVEAGAQLAQIDDAAAKFEGRKAQLELLGARKLAENDVKVRFARKSAEVAAAELRRAVESKKRLSESVTDSELDQLRLVVERATLEIEQAQLDQELAQTASQLKQNDVEMAEHAIAQRKVTAPVGGFVAEIYRRQGEWVQPGQPILRVLRLDRLRAEGLVDARGVRGDLHGRAVKLSVEQGGEQAEYAGKIVFVSPEIDPVSGQVRVWAEIDNRQLQLRPGLHGSMVIAATPAKDGGEPTP
jgi:macrolide-specific efflux system membrane fusion protein